MAYSPGATGGGRPGKQHESTITTETTEPIRQGVTKHFGAVAKNIVTELQLRHDHGLPCPLIHSVQIKCGKIFLTFPII